MKLPISEVPMALKERYGEPVRYRQIDSAARDARIPVQRINGRWYVEEADLPAIAAVFGLAGTASGELQAA